jgi:hypothetical protein
VQNRGVEYGFVSAVDKNLSRQDFLRMGVGLTVLALPGLSSMSCRESAENKAIPAGRLGIRLANAGRQNRANLAKALAHSDTHVVFRAGDYLVDNSGLPLVIEGFEGKLTMEPGACLIFTDNTTRGMTFEGGVGARLSGLRTAFSKLPPARVNAQECVTFRGTTDTTVKGVEISGSAAAGLLFRDCVRPRVEGVEIRGTMADGLHFANCQDPEATNVLTEDTGDDGLAFVNYADGPGYSGGRATGVTVKYSQTRGIAVVGQSGVTVERFAVEGTSGSGLYCAYESSYNTRMPSNVRFADGTVHNAGRLDGANPNKYGIAYSNVASVDFESIEVTTPATRGVSGVAPEGTVRLSGIEVQDAPGSGFDLGAEMLYLEHLTARRTGRTGIRAASSGLVSYGTLKAVDASKTDTLRRAFSFENNARVEGGELYVVDDQSPPTGYEVISLGNRAGRLGKIYDRVANGSVEITNSPGLAYDLREI